MTSGSSLSSVPTATTETAYLSVPWVSGILNGVEPVWRAQGKSHWALPAQGSTVAPSAPTTAPPSTLDASTNLSRTLAIEGELHPQSVIALPDFDRMTQLISTAPPSIFTQADSRQPRNKKAIEGFIFA
jgi:hypothetical protein